MGKKKGSNVQDDFLEQLLDDVQNVDHDLPLEGESLDQFGDLQLSDNSLSDDQNQADSDVLNISLDSSDGEQPVGLTPDEHKIEKTSVFIADSPNKQNSFDNIFQGPSAGEGGYQSIDDLNKNIDQKNDESSQFDLAESDKTKPVGISTYSQDGTVSMAGSTETTHNRNGDHESTVAADGFALRKSARQQVNEKVAIGSLRGSRPSGQVFTSMDASLAQAENLKLAQARIADLEKENDKLRQENDEVSSAADIIRVRLEELSARITSLEREKVEVQESLQNEIMILKGSLQYKESEVAKARLKIDELESRLKTDFRKIRVKERELENRLELARAEKSALVRSKDETILELKRKIDQQQSEIDNYREKLLELNKTVDTNQDQFKRTVRALRLALANLEAKDETVVPIKKAE